MRWINKYKLTEGHCIKRTFIAVLLSAALIGLHPQQLPPVQLNKQVAQQPTKAVAALEATPTPVSVDTTATPQPEPSPVEVQAPTTHEELMAAAGINPADYGAVDYIISHESSWNPDATEPTTGAHGLPQALPYSKTGCGWSDAICQLQWADTYAKARYGGWWEAYNYWVAHRNW